ncbi:MAG: FMN-binding protein [Clostridiales bacterium]|nr:FMN-binding protein [Clostridiales bacterium]MDY5469026.1 FMN-binding protein [Eubacteriales bacterium]
MANNSTNVDAVTGATKTSEAFIAAVNDALAKAGK